MIHKHSESTVVESTYKVHPYDHERTIEHNCRYIHNGTIYLVKITDIPQDVCEVIIREKA